VRGRQRLLELAAPAVRRATSVRPPRLWPGTIAQYWYRSTPNVGDLLSPAINQRVFGVRTRWVQPGFQGKVLGTGSILHSAADDDLVLGAGAIDARPLQLPSSARVLAVRGPRTLELLRRERGEIAFGDPGLLAAQLFPYQPVTPPSDRRIAVVVHYVDDRRLDADDVTTIDVRAMPEQFLQRLVEARVVISSSLHGIVLAESYGIPAIWLSPPEALVGGRFKFDDYFEGTGRTAPAPLALDEAIELARADETPSWRPDTSGLRRAFGRAAPQVGR